MRPVSHHDTTINTTKAAATSPTSPPAITQLHSTWHSPLPYLFGGLAAMLGLISFALLILACSYWRFPGRLGSEDEGDDQRDLESGNEMERSNSGKAEKKVHEEKFLVIMAGNEKPTFLATPLGSKISSFETKIDHQEEEKTESFGDHEKVKNQEMIGDSHDQARTTINTETQENQQEVQEEQN